MDQRKALLEAAITCLQERGYARTTTRDIVATAGSHLPAVNYYFGSKERLLEEAIVEALRRWTETTMAAARDPSHATPRERLHGSLERFFATLEPDRPYVVATVESLAQAERSDRLRQRLAETYEEFRDEVGASVESETGLEGGTPGPEAIDVASVLGALFDGLAIQWLLDPRRVPDAERVMRSLEVLAAALTTER